MDEQNLEEEIDTLEYIFDNIDTATSLLKTLPSEDYNFLLLQSQELLNNIDFVLSDKQDVFDAFCREQLEASRLDRYEREIEYRKMQGF